LYCCCIVEVVVVKVTEHKPKGVVGRPRFSPRVERNSVNLCTTESIYNYYFDNIMSEQGGGSTAGDSSSTGLGAFLRGVVGLGSPKAKDGTSQPKSINVQRQDSYPEMVSTPTDVGIWEVSHDMPDGGKFSWSKLFSSAQQPKSPLKKGQQQQEQK
jgi:hypothetical protein